MKIIIIILLFFSHTQSEKGIYHSTPDRSVDILHSVIDIKLDFLSESVIGKVIHTFIPLGSSVSNLDLDADILLFQLPLRISKSFPQELSKGFFSGGTWKAVVAGVATTMS